MDVVPEDAFLLGFLSGFCKKNGQQRKLVGLTTLFHFPAQQKIFFWAGKISRKQIRKGDLVLHDVAIDILL